MQIEDYGFAVKVKYMKRNLFGAYHIALTEPKLLTDHCKLNDLSYAVFTITLNNKSISEVAMDLGAFGLWSWTYRSPVFGQAGQASRVLTEYGTCSEDEIISIVEKEFDSIKSGWEIGHE